MKKVLWGSPRNFLMDFRATRIFWCANKHFPERKVLLLQFWYVKTILLKFLCFTNYFGELYKNVFLSPICVTCGKLFSVLLPLLTLYNFIHMLIHCDLYQNSGLQLPAFVVFCTAEVEELAMVQLQESQ